MVARETWAMEIEGRGPHPAWVKDAPRGGTRPTADAEERLDGVSPPFARPSGCVSCFTRFPRVGAFAPTRGYRLKRLRRRPSVWHLGTGDWQLGNLNLQTDNCPPHFTLPTQGLGLQTSGT